MACVKRAVDSDMLYRSFAADQLESLGIRGRSFRFLKGACNV